MNRDAFARELGVLVGDGNVQGVPVTAGEPPAWQVAPGSAAEVAEVVRRCNRDGVAVLPVGSGARPTRWKAVAERPRVHVAMRRMDHVVHLDETSLLVHVQAGLTGAGLEKVLVPRGLSLGDYPATMLGSTIGGMIAVRTPGKSSARHGFLEDAVLGVSAVLADGRSIHTRVAPRRATGPDLARALCGSEGTIGVITSVVLRIHLKAEARLLAAYVLPSFDAALAAAYLALREECQPAGLRVYDSAEARAHLGDELALAGPALDDDAALLLVATAGPTDLAVCDRDLVTSAVEAEGGAATDPRLADAWWKLRGGDPRQVPPPSLQVTATPSKLRAVYRAVRDAARDAGATARAHVSRFDAGGAVVFVTLVADGKPLDGARLDAVRATCEQAAGDAGGWLLGARPAQMDPYLAALRAELDPNGILNPGALS
ncbi:MAG: FAD-binding oxidoreductase [Kofleriaceae bacterium]|nr:FAD-binding oxidoreductase [Kofleriaceae bacterium]MCB9571588.1 FAD-binding oxidoreductase [Kofleriaceae bacterium]